ncbi:MAG TPA: hypothetical protein H9880_13145 [Candidatus Anaerobutyricum avicola]|nr:hypothetical protein [Candidatus Anaerobutyricum avicola]
MHRKGSPFTDGESVRGGLFFFRRENGTGKKGAGSDCAEGYEDLRRNLSRAERKKQV